ncbi:MAG: glycosyltransferase [Burkholderiales bacterium]|nr:glycosyltransferase [Burkholderiales bacterium]
MKITSIHQFAFACSAGSGVTNSLFYVQKLLRELGFESHIFSSSIPSDLSDVIQPASTIPDNPDSILMVHHCLGYDNADWLFALAMRKIMIYHNITPPEFLPEGSELQQYAVLGREQLQAWQPHFFAAIGDSPLNSAELLAHAYTPVRTIPLLVDAERWKVPAVSSSPWSSLKDTYNLLFVGRICENKNQLALVELAHALSRLTAVPVRLILAGETTSPLYHECILQRVEELGMQSQVLITGKLSDQDLIALYQVVDVFVCMSEHEGFGMPLIEAMHFDLPVIAKNSSNIANTLGQAGWLMSATSSISEIAAAILSVMKEPALKRDLIQTQRQHLKHFSKQSCLQQLREYFRDVGIEVSGGEIVSSQEEAQERWQIEGPFDSSYSLAIVNRELARALDVQGVDVALRSHEGFGDFEPSSEFLQQDVDCQRMVHRYESAAQRAEPPYAALRFCYPPHVDAMPAVARVVHSYGWEETGFPQAYVEAFNRRLDLITVLSTSVGKTLRDNGVRIPIVVTGAGVDHIQPVQAQALPQSVASQLKAFRFLHVSSCFPRKAVDVLLQAYADTFTAQDEVTLIIKTFANPHHQILRDIDLLKATHPSFPHVVVIDEDWSQAAMAGLYAACHAYVAASRGEGLGLPLAEAMLFDLPVITTAWGGQTDFCDETTAWCCDFDFAKAETHMGMTHTLWAEPRRAHLGALMKNLLQLDESEKKRRTNKARERVLEQLSWRQTANRVRQAVDALKSEKLLRKEPKIGWISTWNARCGIANYSHFLTQQIPPSRLRVLANHIPERMAIDQDFVLRCWNAEQAETFEYALETMLEEGIEAVVIQYNFGFCSTQNLAAFLQQLKAHHIQAHVFFHSTADVKHLNDFKSLSTIRAALAQAERLYVHGVEDVNRLKEWGLVDNVVYFPHGIAPMLARQSNKPSRWQDKTVIASYGFLLPHKGIRELIEAFALLRYGNDDYHLLLVNALYPASVSTETEQLCRQRIAELGLQEHVTLITDYLSDQETKQHLSNADLIVFAYQGTQESSSAAVRVGLSAGSPVLVTPLAIFSDVEEAVHYLPGTSADMIAAGIRDFVQQDKQSEEKKSRIAQWFDERNWAMLSRRLVNIIDGLANPLEGGGRNC